MFRRHVTSGIVVGLVFALLAALPGRASAQDEAAPIFDDTIVHDLYFTINTKDWNTLKENFLDNTYYPVDVTFNGQTVRNAGIRSRGTGSRSGEKPGLRLDFDRYTSSQKYLGLKSLVLRNSTQDPSNMHERLSMLMFKRLGLVAPRESYARLYINNAYSGLYVIVESIDKKFLKAQYGDDDGYLYKYDYNVTDSPYYFAYRTSDPADYVPHPFKPETHESDARPEVFERFAFTINDAPAAGFAAAISEFIDIPGFIRHVASEIFVADNDGFVGNWGMNNYYIYRVAESHQFQFIDWDKSESFKDSPDYWIWHNDRDVPEAQRNRLWARLMALPEYRNYFLDVLLECAAVANEIPAGSDPADTRGWLAREVERQFQQITPAVTTDANKPYTNEQFYAAVEQLRQFAAQRADIVRQQVAESR